MRRGDQADGDKENRTGRGGGKGQGWRVGGFAMGG